MPDETVKQINDSENAKLFRSRMDIFVLNALNEKDGEGYGYDVISYIQEHTHGHYKIKSLSTIYNILKRLEAQGFVVSQKGGSETNGAVRVYYTLTEEGKAYLEQDKKEWKYIRTLLDGLVSDEEFDLDKEEPPYSASILKPFTKRSPRDGGESDSVEYAEEEPAAATVDTPSLSAFDQALTERLVSVPTFAPVSSPTSSEQVSVSFSPNIQQITNDTFSLKPTLEPVSSVREAPSYYYPEEEEDVPYERETVRETVSEPSVPPKKAPVFRKDEDYMELFKKTLQKEGIGLYPFDTTQKADTIAYYNVGKIVRDTSFASLLYWAALLLVLYIWRNIFAFSLFYVHIVAGIGLGIVVVCFLLWAKSPHKRKKCILNLKLFNSVIFLSFLAICFVSIAVLLFLPNGYSLKTAPLYVPSVLATVLPFSGLVFTLLYKSGNYSK